MIRKSKNKVKTLSEKIEELLNENNAIGSENSEDDEFTAPKVVDFDENEYEIPDKRTTDIRKRNVKLLSEKSLRYAGQVSSRHDLERDDVESTDSDESDGDRNNENESESDDENNDTVNNDEDSEVDDVDVNYDENDSIDDGSEVDRSEEEIESPNTNVMSKTNHQAEIQKGVCVQNQLHIWERLLELRIQIQKILSKSNQLPEPAILAEVKDDNEVVEQSKTNVALLLRSLLELQKHLYEQQSDVKIATASILKRKYPFSNSTTEPFNKKLLCEHLEKQFNDFRPYRNSVLLKWDDRTKLLSSKGGARRHLQNEDYDIIKKIESTLLNKNVLIERSRTFKPIAKPSGAVGEEDSKDEKKIDPNVYDDSEFYHQQLRELIEYKTNSSASISEVTKQFVELQKLRQKIKKKVDTRASKGRKLRYAVHNKLINFMAPDETSTWTEEAKDELVKSLFV